MSSILKVDALQKSDGTDGVHIAGHVIQTVNTHHPDGSFAFSGSPSNLFSATITPKYQNSKILITGHMQSERITADQSCYYYANLGRSIAGGGNTFLTRIVNAIGYQAPQYMRQSSSNAYLDVPNTTSSIEYIVGIDFYGTGTHNIKITSLTLIEIAQ